MARSAYQHKKCELCGKEVSMNGLATTNHRRLHVREGLMTEKQITVNKRGDKQAFFEMTEAGRAKWREQQKGEGR